MANNIARRVVILRFIIDYRKENGYSPTAREIMRHIGVSSTSTMYGWLHRLNNEGYLAMDYNIERSVEPTRKAARLLDSTKFCPCCGAIMEENHE